MKMNLIVDIIMIRFCMTTYPACDFFVHVGDIVRVSEDVCLISLYMYCVLILMHVCIFAVYISGIMFKGVHVCVILVFCHEEL